MRTHDGRKRTVTGESDSEIRRELYLGQWFILGVFRFFHSVLFYPNN